MFKRKDEMMSRGAWDQEWEAIHQNEKWGQYPSEHLIRFVARTFRNVTDRAAVRILEIGCGQGAQVWFLAREGFSTVGLDGSPTAIAKAKERMVAEGVDTELVVADAADMPWPDDSFDLVVDMECLMGCRYDDAEKILQQAHRVLKPGGWLYSQTFTDRTHVGEKRQEVERLTFRNVEGGQLARKRLIRLTAEQDIPVLYGAFGGLSYEVASCTAADRSQFSEEWIITGQRA
ncbi:class I SAM-dependent methyltransferase [Pseudomonadota bacterium]